MIRLFSGCEDRDNSAINGIFLLKKTYVQRTLSTIFLNVFEHID